MPYSSFTVRRIKQEFGIQTQEGGRFLPLTPEIAPSSMLAEILENYLPWAIAVGSEKAKSEMIVAPVLSEVRRNGGDDRSHGLCIATGRSDFRNVDLDDPRGLDDRDAFVISSAIQGC